MLMPLTPILARAEGDVSQGVEPCAIGSFNVYSYETVRGVIEAGADKEAPVIVAFGERYLENMDFETVAAQAAAVSARLRVDYALHLDHCKSLDHCFQAMAAGFTSIMYDGSALPFEENVANTTTVVRVAHALGVSVEAELGSLAAGVDSQEAEGNETHVYTDPAQAREFIERTGVDALAVSIGTVHGSYKGDPDIRLDVLKAIRAVVDVPLVLHGGSGTPEATIRECIRGGIRKINVNTEISTHTAAKLRVYLADRPSAHLSNISLAMVDYVKESVAGYLDTFGSNGR